MKGSERKETGEYKILEAIEEVLEEINGNCITEIQEKGDAKRYCIWQCGVFLMTFERIVIQRVKNQSKISKGETS